MLDSVIVQQVENLNHKISECGPGNKVSDKQRKRAYLHVLQGIADTFPGELRVTDTGAVLLRTGDSSEVKHKRVDPVGRVIRVPACEMVMSNGKIRTRPAYEYIQHIRRVV